MHRAADLLVEQDIPRELVYPVVQPERDLAQIACALVLVEHREQELLPARCSGVDHFTVLEREPDVLHLVSAVDSRVCEAHRAGRGVLDGPCKHLAIREVVGAAGVDPLAAADPVPKVGVRRLNVYLVVRCQHVRDPLLLVVYLAPLANGVVLIQQAGAEHELLVVGERHASVLSVGLGGEEG